MLDFRRTPKPRDYFSRRQQLRLLTLVMALGLAIILMNEAAKPSRWRWLAPQSQATTPNAAAAPDAADSSSGGYFPGVRPELLAAVRDKARFRAEEQDAWFHLFAILKAADPVALREASIGRIARIQLSEQSSDYRGELVTIVGVIRGTRWKAAPKNNYGIAGYYQTWVQPDDSPEWPTVVYCLEWPKDFPQGMNIAQRAVVTGFYFKQWLYKSKGGLDVAPVILARDVQREELPSWFSEALPLGEWSWVVVIAVAALMAALVVSYIYRRTRRRPRRQPQAEPSPQTEPRP